jgi:hypothetical protein
MNNAPTKADATRLLAHWRRRADGIRQGRSVETNPHAATAIELCASLVEGEDLDVMTDVRTILFEGVRLAGLLAISGKDTSDIMAMVVELETELSSGLLAIQYRRAHHFLTAR